MCGIAGVIYRSEQSLEKLPIAVALQSHRGPDGSGVLIGSADHVQCLMPIPTTLSVGHTALFHHRLAIIDLSNAAAQPMADAEGRYWMVYNGEIYNYRELRRELEQLGQHFSTESDTEVILSAYRQWGNACWQKFRGMWALVIWDRQRDEFIFSRDRFGIKPLFYYAEGGQLIFASEIKTILSALPQMPAINRTAVVQFLDYGLVDHLPQTFWQGITPFPPASYAVVRREQTATVTAKTYWHITATSVPTRLDDAAQTYRELFSESVKEHLVSDVPIGFCLSGGVDSSSIACTTRKLSPDAPAFNAYTAGYDGFALDERRWAKIVADATKATPHNVLPDASTMNRDWELLLWHQGQPFAGFSIFAQWCVMKRVHETGIKVVLDGQGADETVAGYRKFYYFYMLNLARRRHFARLAVESACMLLQGDQRILHIPRHSRHLPAWLRHRENWPISYLDDVTRERMMFRWKPTSKKSLSEWQKDDIFTLSLPALLRYEDRNSMAFSVESRVPFLDHRLVEYSLGLPDAFKLRHGRTKAVLRRAMRGIVPDPILDRRTKIGFEVPQETWLKGMLHDRLHDSLLNDFRFSGWLDHTTVRNGIEEFAQGANNGNILARLFILNEWARRFFIRI